MGNFCDAPIRMNTKTGKLDVRLSYYYIGQFSRFLPTGSVRTASTGYSEDLEHIAFGRPDGSTALMLLNRRDYDLPVIIRMDGWWKTLEVPAHSLSTVLIE